MNLSTSQSGEPQSKGKAEQEDRSLRMGAGDRQKKGRSKDNLLVTATGLA